MTKYKLLVAASTEGAIGLKNQLLWRLPSDMKQFRALTLNQIVVMGRLTYESIGKALPNRENIVISKQSGESIRGYQPEVKVFESPEKVVSHFEGSPTEKDVWIIGGNQIYKSFLPLVSTIHYSNVLVGKPLTEGVDFDTKFNSIYDLVDSGEWVVEKEPTKAIFDKDSYLLADDKKKPLTYVPYVLTRRDQ